jgi:hypothetical protein
MSVPGLTLVARSAMVTLAKRKLRGFAVRKQHA